MEKGSVSTTGPGQMKPSPEIEELQYLMPISDDDYNHLKKDIEKNGVRDAIKCRHDDEGNLLILGGLNRWKIAKELNLPEIPYQVYTGTKQEFRELVINDNLNRRHLSIEDKKRIAAEFFKINPERSANDVAKKTGVDDKTAGKVKKDLQARSEIPNVGTIDTKGRKQPDRKPAVKPVQPAPEQPGKAANKNPDKIPVNYEKAYSRLLNVIEQYIKKNPNSSGIKGLKTDIENIKNIIGEN